MTREILKIGNYTEEEIFQYLAGENGSALGRSMYDAIFDFIHALITEKDQLKKDKKTLQKKLQTQCQSLQTKIDEAIDYIKPKLKLKNKNGFPYPLFKRAHINHILKILERTDK